MSSQLVQAVLSIAGSDPSGGAGLQADLKTLTRLKVYGAAVPVNLTIQNTQGVSASHPIAGHIIYAQIKAVISDLNVSHIKIGMIGTTEAAVAVSEAISDFQGEVIYDPVLAASSGMPLLDQGGIPTDLQNLINCATVLTPNLDELIQISKQDCPTTTDALKAAQGLFKNFPALRAVILTGGHLPENRDTITNYLILAAHPESYYPVSFPRISTPNSHGTGCTFSSAFAAYHLHSGNYEQAFRQGSAFVWRLLKASVSFKTGHGNGGLLHFL